MTAGASACTVPAVFPSLLARCPPLTMPGPTSIDARSGRTWRRNMVSITADKNTVAVVVPMTTVMSFNIVSGPVNPVSIKSGAVEPVAVVRVLVGVPVGMSYLKVPPGMMSHALFPRLGGDMVEGGPVRAIPGGPSLGETRPPSHSARKAHCIVSRGSVGRRSPSEPHPITPTMNGAGCSRLPLFPRRTRSALAAMSASVYV